MPSLRACCGSSASLDFGRGDMSHHNLSHKRLPWDSIPFILIPNSIHILQNAPEQTDPSSSPLLLNSGFSRTLILIRSIQGATASQLYPLFRNDYLLNSRQRPHRILNYLSLGMRNEESKKDKVAESNARKKQGNSRSFNSLYSKKTICSELNWA